MQTDSRGESARISASLRQGWLYGVLAYVLWGALVLYWPLINAANPLEIFAHRVVWSCVMLVLLVIVARRTKHFTAIFRDRRARGLLAVGSLAMALTWLLNIWGVNFGRVIELSIGAFISPLMIVLLGVLFMRERLTRMQWLALAVTAVAVVVLTLGYGRFPWLALSVAFLFSVYGLLKKLARVEAIESLAYETVILAPAALGYLIFITVTGSSTFTTEGWGHAALLVASGVAATTPLLFFSAASVRISMVSIGVLQYIVPIMQFLLGIFWFREEMTTARWVGVALVWVALVLFTTSALTHNRRQLRLAAESSGL